MARSAGVEAADSSTESKSICFAHLLAVSMEARALPVNESTV